MLFLVVIFCSLNNILNPEVTFWMLLVCFSASGYFLIWNNEMTNGSLLITFSLFNFFPLFISSRWGRRQVYLSYLNIFRLRLKIFCKLWLRFQVSSKTLKTSWNIATCLFSDSAGLFLLVDFLQTPRSLLPNMPKFVQTYAFKRVLWRAQCSVLIKQPLTSKCKALPSSHSKCWQYSYH